MIDVVDNKKCCGCGACQQACPKQCIELITDTEGFNYPKVDITQCVECHFCENICPMLHPGEPSQPLMVEAMRFREEQKRMESSSGGVFTAIAEAIISRKGVVFGATWTEDWRVEHCYAETIEGLAAFRGSKYLQSDTRDTYRQVHDFLRQGRWVLFSGTPCQVRALHLFLRKSYDKLLTTDFICHGVPSHKVFMAYVKDELKNLKYSGKRNISISDPIENVRKVNFRDKVRGWKKYSLSFQLDMGNQVLSFIMRDSAYMKGFGANLFLRPSCHKCPAKKFSSGSDFTLADYWGIEKQHPEMDDDKGTSLIAVNSAKAEKFIESICQLERLPVNPETAYKYQISLHRSMIPSRYREEFWASDYANDFGNIVNRICKRRTLKQRIVNFLKYVLRKLGVKKVYQFIKRNLCQGKK